MLLLKHRYPSFDASSHCYFSFQRLKKQAYVKFKVKPQAKIVPLAAYLLFDSIILIIYNERRNGIHGGGWQFRREYVSFFLTEW